MSEPAKRGGWTKAALIGMLGLGGGAAGTYATAVVDRVVKPTKPVGPFLSRHRARELARRKGWHVVEDAGRGWRKVVPSPRPVEILNREVVRGLLKARVLVIAGGGGGVPVRSGPGGRLRGVEAVIDKDFTAAMLARDVGATQLVLLTGVAAAALGFGQQGERQIGLVSASEMARHLAAGAFGEGSMAPKVQASLDFLAAGGGEAIITNIGSLAAALRGRAGTRIQRDRWV